VFEAAGLIVGAIIAAVAGVVAQWFSIRESKRSQAQVVLESQRTRAQEALEWMTGESQRRNVGIAAIEASWTRWQDGEFQNLVIPVLCGSATYLLSASDQTDKGHELYNLDRIMALLTERSEARYLATFRDGYDAVMRAVRDNAKYAGMTTEQRTKLRHTGLFVDPNKLTGWESRLASLGVSLG
jgi:hypothetical protein